MSSSPEISSSSGISDSEHDNQIIKSMLSQNQMSSKTKVAQHFLITFVILTVLLLLLFFTFFYTDSSDLFYYIIIFGVCICGFGFIISLVVFTVFKCRDTRSSRISKQIKIINYETNKNQQNINLLSNIEVSDLQNNYSDSDNMS